MLDAKKKGWLLVIIQFIILAAIFIISYRDFRKLSYYGIDSYIGLAIMIIGLILALVSFFSFGQMMTPNPVPMQNYNLITSGMYKYIRHPVYSTILFALLGAVLLSKSVIGFIIWLAAVIFLILKIGFEEKQLELKFPDYAKYRRRTKKLIPFIY